MLKPSFFGEFLVPGLGACKKSSRGVGSDEVSIKMRIQPLSSKMRFLFSPPYSVVRTASRQASGLGGGPG